MDWHSILSGARDFSLHHIIHTHFGEGVHGASLPIYIGRGRFLGVKWPRSQFFYLLICPWFSQRICNNVSSCRTELSLNDGSERTWKESRAEFEADRRPLERICMESAGTSDPTKGPVIQDT
jgi:hypothetical protein